MHTITINSPGGMTSVMHYPSEETATIVLNSLLSQGATGATIQRG